MNDLASGNRCDDCGRGPLNLSMPGLYFEVYGWEEQRSQGGANKITLRKRTGRVICGGCMADRRAGISRDQEGLPL